MAQRTCSVEGCDGKHFARGFCNKHYGQRVRSGELVPGPRKPAGTCSIDGCDRPHNCRGWCSLHYQRWMHHGDALYERPGACKVDGCEKPVHGRGWCLKHWSAWYKRGDPLFVYVRPTPEERFWAKVDKNGPPPPCRPDLGPCWLWVAAKNHWGYGKFGSAGAHRFAYETMVGPIPEGLELDHLCRVRHCVNPGHLEAVTGRVNLLRGNGFGAVNARKTHCPKGHEYDLINTQFANGRRKCRTCIAEYGKLGLVCFCANIKPSARLKGNEPLILEKFQRFLDGMRR